MGGFSSQIADLIAPDFADAVQRYWFRKSRILILVDGRIAVTPSPPPTTGDDFVIPDEFSFGISIAIATVKSFAAGFSSFEVTVATRDIVLTGPVSGYDITGFRFSAETLANFDQVWLFGIWPDNFIGPNPNDGVIEDAKYNPLSDSELAALARWMDAGGGVFAAGDHHFLGASMCHKVPRVSAMRAWTIAAGVPTQFSATRYGTTRPATSAETSGAAVISESNELDHVPQRIEWVSFGYFKTVSTPHPLLCHPVLGPIDVLPDHMHEGRCYDFSDPAWIANFRDLGFDFGTYQNQQFPMIDGMQPLPQVVAWGRTPADPPFNYSVGDQPFRRFPNIAAYDGQQIGIGRVIVDSTWHHWFDMNLRGFIKQSYETGNRSALDRILRYYINVGIYLASPYWRSGMVFGWLKAVQFGYFGRQAIDLNAPAEQIGKTARRFLNAEMGPCWVRQFILDQLQQADGHIWGLLNEKLQAPEQNAWSLAYEVVEETMLGEIVRAAYADTDELRGQIASTGQLQSTPLLKTLDKGGIEAARRGFNAAVDAHLSNLKRAQDELEALSDAIGSREGTAPA